MFVVYSDVLILNLFGAIDETTKYPTLQSRTPHRVPYHQASEHLAGVIVTTPLSCR